MSSGPTAAMSSGDGRDDDLVIRPGEPADLPAVAEVFLAARLAAIPHMSAPGHTREEIVAFWTGIDLTSGERELWVAEDVSGVVGFAEVKGEWLDDLYVHPGAQGRGVGSALLEVVKAVRPGGFGLWVFASNLPARAFYAAHGCVEHETTDGSANEERAPDVRLSWS